MQQKEVILAEGHIISYEVVIECPFCGEIMKAQSPDKLRFAYSVNKPPEKSYGDTVIRERLICKNPQCKRRITIYWYAQLVYIDRV